MARTSIIGEGAADEIDGKFEEVERHPQKHESLNRDRDFVKMTIFVPRPTHKWLKITAEEMGTSFQGIAQEAFDDWLQSHGGPKFFPRGWRGWTPKEDGK
jgi:hypothetical protein